MKKMIIAAAVALMGFTAVSAQQQQRMSQEEIQKMITERIEKAADRMAKDFDLKGDAKTAFVSTFTAYQTEMFATNQPQGQGQRGERAQENDEKKDLTAEEATAKIKETLDRQETQIATLQARLNVQKKYAEEFGKVLTPQQVLKVLTPQQRNQNQRNGQGQQGQRGGFGGQGGFGGPRGGFGGGGFGPGF